MVKKTARPKRRRTLNREAARQAGDGGARLERSWSEGGTDYAEFSAPLEGKLALETLEALIDAGYVDELPFELLAEEYPSLLKDWYPGYPGEPRMMTEKDPIAVRGVAKDGIVTLLDVPGLADERFPIDGLPDGEHQVWIQLGGKPSINLFVVPDSDEPAAVELVPNCQ